LVDCPEIVVDLACHETRAFARAPARGVERSEN
jgi:hypothetical protein